MNINTSFFVCFRMHIYKSNENSLSPKDHSLLSFTYQKDLIHLFMFQCIFILPFIFRFILLFIRLTGYSFFPFDLVLWHILFDVIIRKGAHAVVNRQGQI